MSGTPRDHITDEYLGVWDEGVVARQSGGAFLSNPYMWLSSMEEEVWATAWLTEDRTIRSGN